MAYWSQHDADLLNDTCLYYHGICVQETSLHKQNSLRCITALANDMSVCRYGTKHSILFANNDTKLQTDIDWTEIIQNASY